MAVTLDPADLIYPKGELQPASFPDGDIEDVVLAWLDEAIARLATVTVTDQNEAAKHHVYWRGFTAIATRLAVKPSTEQTSGERSTSYGTGQINALYRQADFHREQFEQLAQSETVQDPPPSSGTAANTMVW